MQGDGTDLLESGKSVTAESGVAGENQASLIVERSFAWYQKFRRLVVRYETTSSMYLAFVHPACLLITLEQF